MPSPILIPNPSFPAPLFRERHIDVNGVERDYMIHEPFSPNANRSYPLIMAFHGGTPVTTDREGTKDARHSMVDRWTAIAEALPDEVYIICPPADWVPQDDGTNRGRYKWRHVLPDTAEVPREDLDFIAALLDRYATDPGRTYAVGFSSGGGMTGQLTLLDDFVDRFNGFAVVSFPVYLEQKLKLADARAQATPKPLFYMHGTADDNWVPYADDGDGEEVIQMMPPEIMRAWKERNHTRDEPEHTVILTVDRDMAMIEQLFVPATTEEPLYALSRQRSRPSAHVRFKPRRMEFVAGQPLAYLANINAGHNWPQLDSQGATRITTISATYLIWNFWTIHAGLLIGHPPILMSAVFDPEQET